MRNTMAIEGMVATEKYGLQTLAAHISLGDRQDVLSFSWRGSESILPGDAMALSALQPAMAAGADIVTSAPLSQAFVDNHLHTQRRLQCLDPALEIIDIRASDIQPLKIAGRTQSAVRTGILFDGSVDAFYTFLQRRNEIHTVVHVADYIEGRQVKYREGRAIKTAAHRARELGTPHVYLESNLRHFLASTRADGALYGPIHSGVAGLLMSGDMSRLIVPGSSDVSIASTQVGGLLNGTYPGLFSFFQEGIHIDLPDKINALTASADILEALRTCWDNPRRSYNCGRCAKCTRTVPASRLLALLSRESRSLRRQATLFP